MDSTKPLVTQQLNSTLIAQLVDASYSPWVQASIRNNVTDLIRVEDGHIIINPNSNVELGTGTLCIFEHGAKQAVYAVLDLILDVYTKVAVGAYELYTNPDKAYSNKAALFMNVKDVGWTAFHKVDKDFLPMDLPETGQATELMRLKYQWMDLVIKGAYIDLNVEIYAPQLYNYFASLLTMVPQDAADTIDAHMENARERRIAWAASQAENPEPASEYVIDGKTFDTDTVKGLKKVYVRKGERIFSSGTSSTAELAHLTYLLQNGYTLSQEI